MDCHNRTSAIWALPDPYLVDFLNSDLGQHPKIRPEVSKFGFSHMRHEEVGGKPAFLDSGQ